MARAALYGAGGGRAADLGDAAAVTAGHALGPGPRGVQGPDLVAVVQQHGQGAAVVPGHGKLAFPERPPMRPGRPASLPH
jgi:hypothetical protein